MHLGRWDRVTSSDDWVYEEEVREEGISCCGGGKMSSFLSSLKMGLEDGVAEEKEGASGVVSCGFFRGEDVSIFSSAILFSLF